MLRHPTTRCLCALFASALPIMLVACEGTYAGRAQVVSPVGHFDVVFSHTGATGSPCGSLVIGGVTYMVYCDGHGNPVYLEPADAPGRRMPVRPNPPGNPIGLEHVTPFEFEGSPYVVIDLPEVLMPFEADAPASDLLDEHAVTSNGDLHEVAFWLESGGGVADLRIAMSSNVGLPDPFAFDMPQETIVVPDHDGGPAFVMHRLVGPPRLVLEYVRTAGLTVVLPIRPDQNAMPREDPG